eukprot:211499-Rhodomonas_salina.1
MLLTYAATPHAYAPTTLVYAPTLLRIPQTPTPCLHPTKSTRKTHFWRARSAETRRVLACASGRWGLGIGETSKSYRTTFCLR